MDEITGEAPDCGTLGDERGATAVEYGLMVLFVAVAIITVVTLLGTTLAGLFTQITAGL